MENSTVQQEKHRKNIRTWCHSSILNLSTMDYRWLLLKTTTSITLISAISHAGILTPKCSIFLGGWEFFSSKPWVWYILNLNRSNEIEIDKPYIYMYIQTIYLYIIFIQMKKYKYMYIYIFIYMYLHFHTIYT